jgi:hypothetical protein
VILIEACEESGSYDLPYYVDHLAERIGKPSLVVCLDSGCANYDQLWCTTSLRGLAGGNLRVRVLSEGVHSGDASGIVPFELPRAAPVAVAPRGPGSGKILIEQLQVEIPSSACSRPARRGSARQRRLRQVPVPARHVADGFRPHRDDPQPHLAADALGDRRRTACRRCRTRATCCAPSPR